MDKASVIGTVIGVAAMLTALISTSGGNLLMFWSFEGGVMVAGGIVSVTMMALPLDKFLGVPGYIRAFLFYKGMPPSQVVDLMGRLSEKARRDGILALESEIEALDNAFLKSGLKMTVDGVDPNTIETTLRLELIGMQDRHKAGKKFFDLIKLYGPGYGLVGTLVGQIGLFASLGSADLGQLGKALALAVVSTMYGALLANAVAGPIGDKLAVRSGEEIVNREMMLQGILSIQAGDNPRVTQDKMLAFIPQTVRTKLREAA